MRRPQVHLICNAHLDPVWQWRWEEGCAEALATFRTAATLLREHDRLIFNHNEAVLYQWVQRYDPDLFLDIQRLVAEGRWCISGGWYIQPDANLPGMESFVRHIMEGRRFFAEHFGARPKVAYNFDSFGHGGGLPQILRRCGYEMYIHLRPPREQLPLPSDLYRWRGVDGTEIAVLRIMVGFYHTERDNIEHRLSEGVEAALRLNRDVPVFWGLGNHGGGATREDLRKIDAFVEREKRVEIVHSTTERLYGALADAARTAPIVEGDLQRILTGCYTSLSRVKRGARRSLGRLVQAESLCTAAWWLCGEPFPIAAFQEAWRGHLFNDFHDILPGSCTAPAERDALDLYGHVSETVRRERLAAAVAFNRGGSPDTVLPVTVLNTNPACPPTPVEFECMVDYRPLWTGTWHLRLLRADGSEVVCQEEQPEALLPFNGWRRKVTFLDNLPALGAAHYRVEVVPGPVPNVPAPRPALDHRIDTETGLVTMLDAGDGRSCLAGPLLEPLVVKDEGDSWGSDVWSYREIVGRFTPCGEAPQVIETGPVRTITESVLTFSHSRIVLHSICYAGWPVLEFRLRIHWCEERRRLKLAVPTAFAPDGVECEVPGGIVRRPADGQEHVYGRWFLLERTAGGRAAAVGVVNSGQHGLDLSNGEVRLSVLRSAAYCHERNFSLGDRPARRYMEQGEHDVRVLVTAGDPKAVRDRLPCLADWLDAPPVVYAHLPIGSSRVSAKLELLSLSPGTVRLTACKPSRDGNALIVRIQEATGRETRARLRLAKPPVSIDRPLRPLEIVTLRIERDGSWREADMIDET